MERDKIKKIVAKHRHEKAALLEILHEVQAEDKQLEMDALKYIAQLLKVPFANVYGVATFYSAFSTTRRGETEIRICDGISCHINGARDVVDALRARLNVEEGETTWDEKYSLEKVHCLGLCAVGPNVSFNEKTYSRMDRQKVLEILQEGTGSPK